MEIGGTSSLEKGRDEGRYGDEGGMDSVFKIKLQRWISWIGTKQYENRICIFIYFQTILFKRETDILLRLLAISSLLCSGLLTINNLHSSNHYNSSPQKTELQRMLLCNGPLRRRCLLEMNSALILPTTFTEKDNCGMT